jgi:S1-C subfamily serine protease
VAEKILTGLSADLSALVEAAGPSVVRVESRRFPASGVVWSDDGLVVTAHHAVEWDEGIAVGTADGASVPATLLGRDPTTDIALLRAKTGGLRPPHWVEAAGARVGQLVLALTRPGRSVRASLGIVSVRGDAWRTPAGGRLETYVQTDIARHPGFSGSLLVGAEGEALGMNTSGILRNANLVLPVSTLRRVADALLAHGQVRRGYLGVGTYAVRLPASLVKTLDQPSALLIVSVEDGSPAARAGLTLGDVLISFDGQALRHPADLLPLLDETKIGVDVGARIVRGGEPRDIRLVVGARGEPSGSPPQKE